MNRLITKYKHETNEEGFTLIELMIVVVIIGILAAVAIPIFMNQQKAAIQAGIKSDVKNLQIAVNTYLVKNPTATNLNWRYDSGRQVAGFELNDDPYWQQLVRELKPSNGTTILAVRANGDANSPAGSWDNYYILGANNQDGSTANGNYYRYIFTSTTGKYTEVG